MTQDGRRSCWTMDHHHHQASLNELYQLNRREIESYTQAKRMESFGDVIRIPVVVHVLYREESENISKEQIESQIKVLNEDFRKKNADISKVPEVFQKFAADSLIEFALATKDPQGQKTTGITRTKTSLSSFPMDDELIKMDEHGKAAWPRDQYLNIWVCSLGDSILGYATFPGGPAWSDGVVILNTAFGTNGTAQAPFNLGRTGTHEVGHWLNLYHIWGDDGTGCSGSDNVGDTPNQGGSNFGKPKYPSVSCSNGPDGDMFMNYMDYVDDDTMFMFSTGQAKRMRSALDGPRKSLKSSDGLQDAATERMSLMTEELRSQASDLATHEVGCPVTQYCDGVRWVDQT